MSIPCAPWASLVTVDRKIGSWLAGDILRTAKQKFTADTAMQKIRQHGIEPRTSSVLVASPRDLTWFVVTVNEAS